MGNEKPPDQEEHLERDDYKDHQFLNLWGTFWLKIVQGQNQ